jgi:hypothetical protein
MTEHELMIFLCGAMAGSIYACVVIALFERKRSVCNDTE